MGNPEGFAGNAVEKIALDGFGRRESNRMHQAIQTIPAFTQFGKQIVDLFVAGDIEREDQCAVEFGSELVDAVDEAFVLV